MSHARVIRCIPAAIAAVVLACAPALATISFTNNTLTYSSPSDLGTVIDPPGLHDVLTSFGVSKASFQSLNPQVVGFNGAPAPGTALHSLVVNYSETGTATFTFAVPYNYGSYTSYSRGGFSGTVARDAISTAPSNVDGPTDWFDATITTTGGKGVQALGFCASFRNDQAVNEGQAIFTLSDSTTATVALPALGYENVGQVFIGYQAPAGKTIVRVQASHTALVGGAWVAIDDLSLVMGRVTGLTGDINGDGYVNVGDLQALVAAWGSGPNYDGPADINADGYVNVGDLQLLVAHWGETSHDTTAPAAITDLTTSNPTATSITLTWTAPGDDGSTGTASSYQIRYRTGGPVTEANWAGATSASGVPIPTEAGTSQSVVVSGLASGTTYYFAIKASDEVPNTSAISNSPPGTTVAGGTVWNVSSASALQSAVNSYTPGDVINIAAGTYYPSNRLSVSRGAVTIQGATGNRDDVIIAGPGMAVDSEPREMFDLFCDDVTIKDLTIREVYHHGVHIRAENDVDRTHLQNIRTINCGERHIKGSWNAATPTVVSDDVIIENCLLEQTKENTNHSDNDYISGIDVMGVTNIIIRNNVFANIHGPSGAGRGAIFIWHHNVNCLVEGNRIYGCDRGICMGNPGWTGPGSASQGGILRNNMVSRGANIALELCYTDDMKVYYNTIYSADEYYFRTIHIYDSPSIDTINGLDLRYNIIRGQFLDNATGTYSMTGNIVTDGDISPVPEWFVSPSIGNLHLTPDAAAAFDLGVLLPEVTTDFDGQTRGGTPDIGADEY